MANHFAVLWFVLAGGVCGGEPACQQPRPKVWPDQPSATEAAKADTDRNKADAEKAKAGLLKLIRGSKSLFIGQPDSDRLERMPVKHWDRDDPSKFYWSAFEIDVKEHRYSAEIGSDALGTTWFYSGKFTVTKTGEWVPDKPKVIEAFHRRNPKPVEGKTQQ